MRLDPGLPRPRGARARRRARRRREPPRGDRSRVRRAARDPARHDRLGGAGRATPRSRRRSSRRRTRCMPRSPSRCCANGKHVLVEKPMAIVGGRVRRDDRRVARRRRVADGRALLAFPRRGPRDARPDRGGRARRDREDPRATACTPAGDRAAGSPIRRSREAARSSTWACTRSIRPGSCWAIPRPSRVCATIGTRYAEGRYTVDDDGVVLISWDDGTNSIVECGWWQPHLGGLEADTEVYGTSGYARIWPARAAERGLRALHAADVQRTGGGVPGRDRRGASAAPVGRGRSRGDAGRRGGLPLRGVSGVGGRA